MDYYRNSELLAAIQATKDQDDTLETLRNFRGMIFLSGYGEIEITDINFLTGGGPMLDHISFEKNSVTFHARTIQRSNYVLDTTFRIIAD